MANKDPAVLLYTSDFLAGAALMTMKERGQYITLLCLQRERGHMTCKEMEKAAGKLSAEVFGKFTEDEAGRFYNRRMETEIRKRDAHCQKQKEKIEKRWNVPKADHGIASCNTVVSSTVLPLGNGNGNGTKEESISLSDYGGEDQGTLPPCIPPDAVSIVLSDYLNRINPAASAYSLDELRGYADEMGEAVCRRAFDIALDSKKTTWPYIRGILRRYQSDGVKCLADIEAQENKRSEGKQIPHADGDLSWMKKIIDQRGDET